MEEWESIEYTDSIFLPRTHLKSTILTMGNKMPKGKQKVKIDYSIELDYRKVTYTSGETVIRFGFNSIEISDLRTFHKALNTLAKLSKQHAKTKLRSKPSKLYFPSLPRKNLLVKSK